MRVRALPLPGETVLSHDLLVVGGGKGANQAVAVARLGGRVKFTGCVGEDAWGRDRVRGLRREGVETRGIVRVPGHPTGLAAVRVDDRGRNSIVVAPGANSQLSPKAVRRHLRRLTDKDVVVTQLEVPMPAVEAALRAARAGGALTVLNAAPPHPLPRRLWRWVDIFVVNESEYAAYRRSLPRRCPPVLIVTQGVRGGWVASRAGPWRYRYRAQKVRVVDTTAAGDAFVGALAAGLAETRTLRESVRMASVAGALAASVLGAQPSLPTRRAVQRLLGRGGGYTLNACGKRCTG